MKCYARWQAMDGGNVFVRDQTILQFGESWDLIASMILLNPGSALPMSGSVATEYLTGLGLPYFVAAGEGDYHEFRLDPLMRSVLKAASTVFDGGVIKIYNLFNIKNPNSTEAINNFESEKENSRIYTMSQDMMFYDAPVIFACGRVSQGNQALQHQISRYLARTSPSQLYGLVKSGQRRFGLEPIDDSHVLETYHPSYTFKYGNKTDFSGLQRT